MEYKNDLNDNNTFAEVLYNKMVYINPGLADLELYEFQYLLKNITPELGWENLKIIPMKDLEKLSQDENTFLGIQLNPVKTGKIILDEKILWLDQILMVGLVKEEYPIDWVNAHFYFDTRSFCFFFRTKYFSPETLKHFGNQPLFAFDQKQIQFDHVQEIGYKEFKNANQEIDQALIKILNQVLTVKGSPLLITLAGPTGSGKTEIAERIHNYFAMNNHRLTTIEMDNFYKDREFRDAKPYGPHVIHYDLFIKAMQDILAGKSIDIPRYDFYQALSSHDLDGNLRDGKTSIHIEPADIIFLEGNFPFYLPDFDKLIGLRIVYLTDDPIRLKRKWRRDIDYRKKYDPVGFVNRFFRTQFLRAKEIYVPLMKVSDLVVDTTAAKLWLTPELANEIHISEKVAR